MEQPVFSVIVPMYNVETYIAQCIDSLLAQTFTDFEAVIVDDVSTDGSKAIAMQYAQQHPHKVRLVEHAKNLGLGGARNTGIDAAKGKFLLFLDSDDYLLPDALEKIEQVIRTQQADVVEFCFQFVSEDCQYLRRTYCNPEIPAGYDAPAPLVTQTVNACNKAIRAELMAQVRFPEKRYYEDYWTIPKVLLSDCRIVSLNEPLYGYRQRTTSIMHDTNIEKTNDIMLGMDGLLQYFKEHALGEQKLEELEFLAIRHIILYATLRINGIDRKTPMQRKLKDYMQTNFPNYRSNKYIPTLSRKDQRYFYMINREQYNLLYLTYYCRNRVTGGIKAAIRKVIGEGALRRLG